MADKVDQLYDALYADGAVQNSRENFRNYFLAQGDEGYYNRKNLYDALKADGAVQSPTYEDFMQNFNWQGIKRPVSQSTTNPTGVDADTFITNAKQTIGQSQQAVNRIGNRQQRIGLDIPKTDFGRINLGENRKVTKGQQRFNLGTGQMENTYVTEAGNEYETRAEADIEQNAVDDARRRELDPIGTQLEDLYAEQRKLGDLLDARRKEIEEERNGEGFMTRLIREAGRASQSGNIPDINSPLTDLENDRDYSDLMAAYRKNKQAITTLEDQRDKTTNDFWHSFGTEISNGYTFSLGGKAKMDDIISLTDAQKHIDSINKKRSNGEKLTNEEEIAETVLRNNEWDREIQGRYGDDYGAWARAGKMGANSADFMLDFLMMGGMPAGMAKGIMGAVVKGGERYLGNLATKGLGKFMLKATGATLGSMVAGAEITNTIQLGKTGSDMAKSMMGDVYRDANGNYVFGHYEEDENGNPKFVEGGNDFFEALAEVQRSGISENASEIIGTFLPGGGKALSSAGGQLLEKLGLSKISRGLTALTGKKWFQNYNKFLETAGFNGVIGEGMEEYAGMALDALMGGDEWKNLADPRTHIDIWLGVATMSGIMNAPNLIGTGYSAAQYQRYKQATNKADAAASATMNPETWGNLRETIDNTDNANMADVAMGILDDDNLSDEAKRASMDYINNLQKMRGYSLGSIAAGKEGDESEASRIVNESYTEGYDTQDPDLMKQFNDDVLAAEQNLQQYGEEFAKEIVDASESPVQELDYLMNNRNYFTDEQIAAAADYYTKQSRAKGMMEGALDRIDLQVEQANAEVRANTHLQTGNVITAQVGDRPCCIKAGDVVADETTGVPMLVGTGGAVVVRDAQTGKTSVHSPQDVKITSMTNADEMLQYNEQVLRQQLMQQADDDITLGSPANEVYQLEDTVTLNDGEGNTITGEIVGMPNSIDGVYQVQTNDTNEPMKYLTADELNRRIATHNGMEVQRNNLGAKPDNQQVTDESQTVENQQLEQTKTESVPTVSNQEQPQPQPEQGGVVAGEESAPAKDGGHDSNQPQSALSRIPVNDKGQPDYIQAQPQDSYDALVEELGEEDANAIIESEISDAQKRLQRLEKQQPKGATIEEKKHSLAARRKAVEAEKAQIDYWNSVLEIPRSRKAEADRLAAEEAQRKAVEERKALMRTPEGRRQILDEAKNSEERVSAAKEIYGEYFNDNIGEPETVYELVSLLLPYGKINWEGYDRAGRHVRGLQEEVGSGFTRGLSKDRGTSAFNLYLAKKGEGDSLDSIVHGMYEDDANLSGGEHRFTTEEINDAAIEMLLSAEKPKDIRDYTVNHRIDMAEGMLSAELEAEAEDFADFYHLTPEERETFEDFMSQDPALPNEQEFINQIIAENESNKTSEAVDLQPASGTADRESEGSEEQVQDTSSAETAGADQEEPEPEQGAETPAGKQTVSDNNVSGGTQEPVIAPSEQLKPTDLRDAIRVESSEIGVAEANAKARRISGETDPRTMSEEEKQRRGELLKNAPSVTVEPNQITATPELSARKAAEKWWDEHVPGPQFFDTEVGEVEINRNSVESSLAHQYSQMKLDAITSLVEGFENAVYLGTMPDGTRQEGVKNHYFAYPVFYNGQRCYVFCRALHDSNTNRLYVHEVFLEQNIKKGNTLQTAASQPHGGIALYRDILANVLDSSSGEDVIADLREPGQSDAATDVSKPQTPNENGREPINAETQASSSEGKDTNNSANLQEKTEKSSEKSANKEPKRLVSDARMDELKKKLRNKIGGQLNVGVDPEVLAAGAEMAVGYLERGITRFADFARAMIEEVGDFMRPYLKSFYNAVRDMPEAQGYADQMDDYETVRQFDVHNFDKGGKVPDAITRAQQISDEQTVTRQAGKIKQQHPDLFAGDLFGEQDGNTSSVAKIAAEEDKVDTNPSEAQKEAGNYQKGHIKIDGYDITIENPKGSVRRGVDANGNPWETEMHNTYGYIRGTEGVDGDHIDVFLSDDPTSGNVYVVDQVNPETGEFDEHKVLLSFGSEEEAREAYLSNYKKGWKGLGNITEVSREDLKKWIESSHRKTKPFAEYAIVKNNRQTVLRKLGDLQDNGKQYEENKPEAYELGKQFAGTLPKGTSSKEALRLASEALDANKAKGGVYALPFFDGVTEITKAAPSDKIEDVGEQIAGARKDMTRKIAQTIDSATKQTLAEMPFSKAYKKPDLKKAVEEGALREKDATFYDAWFATMVNPTKPKVTQSETRSKKWNPGYRTKLEKWVDRTYEALQLLKTFVETDEAGRDNIIEKMTDDKFPGREEQLAEIENRKEWNKDRKDIEWGDKTTPNPLWITYEVMRQMGYAPGDKLDIPYGIVVANSTGTGYTLDNNKGERYYYLNPKTIEEAIDDIVYLARIKRGDTDIQHPVSMFYAVPTKSEMGETGKYRVMWGSWSSPKSQVFDSKEDADAFAKKKKEAFVSLVSEVVRRFGYKVMFRHPLTGDKMAVNDQEFDTKNEANAYLDENYEAVNEAVNKLIGKNDAKAQKKELTPDDMVYTAMVRGEDGKYTYGVLIDKQYANNFGMPLIVKEGFASRDEARRYADSVKQSIFDAYKSYRSKMKSFTYFDTGKDSRAGEDYRGGKDVTAEDFMNTFGFRGVQFGNWTNQRDRQMAVNQAYDSFMDLAKLIGVSPKALSLNGELGIAFGARGSGNFAAHYEPGEIVINLTKTMGAGSLAHEWWHALDNYFARNSGQSMGMVTDDTTIPVRKELRDAYNALTDQIRKSSYYTRSRQKGDYWGRMHEVTARLLAEWVDQELKKNGELNTFLSRGANTENLMKINYERYKAHAEMAGKEVMPFDEFEKLDEAMAGSPYPSKAEVGAFSAAMRNIFDVMQERTDPDTGKTALYQKASGILKPQTEADNALRDALIDMMRNAGILVGTDAEVGQEVLDNVGSNVKLSASKKRAVETASLNPKEGSPADISTADGAKIRKDSENAIKKDGKINYFKTKDGQAYGYTYNGKIYIDPSIATSETPIHEYTHLWAEALRQKDPETWKQIVEVLKNDEAVKPFWDKVTQQYPELTDDNDIADEVLAQYSGSRGAERLREVADEVARENKGVFGKAQAVEALRRMKNILTKFWKAVADMMGWKFTSADEVADKVLSDLLNGVNPNNEALKDYVLSEFNRAKEGNAPGERIPFGNLTEAGRKYLEKISGMTMRPEVSFILNASELRHIYNEHYGDNEKDKGNNIPLTDDDIRSLVDVVTSPDKIVFAVENKTGRKLFFFLKNAEGGTYNLAEVYADSKGNLTTKSFYKTKKSIAQRANELMKDPKLSTSETGGESSFSGANIPKLFETSKDFPEKVNENGIKTENNTSPILKAQKVDDGRPRYQEGEDALHYAERLAEYERTRRMEETAIPGSDDEDTAQTAYNEAVARKSIHRQEAWQDSMIALKTIQDAIAKESGKVATGAENAYMFENRMHGRAKNMSETYNWRYYAPMLKAFNELVNARGMTQEQGKDYLIAKSGLERNLYFAFRDAAKARLTDKINDERDSLEKMYAKGRVTEDYYKSKIAELDDLESNGADNLMKEVRDSHAYQHAKEEYTNGNIGYTEYLRILETVIRSQVPRKTPRKDGSGNIVSDNYYDDYAKDYSGLTETFAKEMYDEAQKVKKRAGNAVDPKRRDALWKEYDEKMRQAYVTARQTAEDAVFAAESDRKPADKLWNAINAATKRTLQISYESGMMDRKTYNKVREMFDYYVPLRGWEEDKASDVYNYMGKDNVFSPAVKKTWGRTSQSEDPLAYIGNIAVSTIIAGHRNQMKQHFLNYVMNNPTSLVSVSESWYENVAREGESPVWNLRTANTAGKSADEIAQIVNDFNDEMKQKQAEGRAIPVTGRLRLDVNATKGQKAEHVVEVQRAGHTYQLYINGDPKAAQALNGTNTRVVRFKKIDKVGKAISGLNHEMAAFFTSKNPAFVISNLSRDLNMAGASVAIRESKQYNARFMKNVAKVLAPRMGESSSWVPASKQPTGMMPSLLRKYKNGTLDVSDETERLFKEFMEEGGETGFVNMLSVDSFKEDMRKEIRQMNGSSILGDKGAKEMTVGKGLRLLGETFEFYNRCAEDATRFIVYMTSRQMGKSLEDSIADAKDVTLNFNRKGTGKGVAGLIQDLFIFVNPAIQALANMYRMAKGKPLRFGGVTAGFIAAGALMPFINQWLMGMFGDDDDKEAYWNLPPWVRKNNLVMWIPGTKNFLTIPLAQEFRVFYGLGEMITTSVSNHSVGNMGLELVSSVADLIPINPTGNGGNLLVDLMPTAIQPLVQIDKNIDFTGKPIWRDNEGNKFAPMYTKAYVSTPDWMVKLSEKVNDVTGGNEGKKGWVEQNVFWGDYLNNPAVWNHLLQGYFGGMYNTIAKGFDVFATAAGGEVPKIYQTPVINRFLNRPVERDNAGVLGEEYYNLINERDQLNYELRVWKKKAADGDKDAQKHVDEIMQSDDYQRGQVVSYYEKIIREMKAGEKSATTDSDKDLIKEGISNYRQQMSEELEAIGEGKDPLEAAMEKFGQAEKFSEKNKLRMRIERLMGRTGDNKQKTSKDEVEKALSYIKDEENESRDTDDNYLMLATPDDIKNDARIKVAKSRIGEYTKEYKRLMDSRAFEKANEYRQDNLEWFKADDIIKKQSKAMKDNQKQLGHGHDAAVMKNIANNRNQMLKAIERLKIGY